MKPRFGEILLARGRIDAEQLERALRLQQKEGRRRLGELLLTLGLITEQDVAVTLSSQLDLPLFSDIELPEIPVLEDVIPVRFLKEHRVLPLLEDNEQLRLAMVDPLDQYSRQALQLLTRRTIDSVVASAAQWESGFEKLYGGNKSSMGQIVSSMEVRTDEEDEDLQHLKDLASEAPVIRLVGLILTHAIEARASDIHIEPFESRLIVRYRIDGVLHETESPPKRLSSAVISRIKIMANLDIAERRLPQDGRIRLRIQNKEIDLRVSTIPTMHGESVVMRILDRGGVKLEFAPLGFETDVLAPFLDALHQPHGIVLVTGPTGSGKTTTLYTALSQLNKPDVKIMTVEDPVEYQIDGINQIQVKPQIGLNFSHALRSIVRQDPDIIMIGEIRDLETAQIAVQSALTGHLVLSTLHTNDASSTINRLLDMGVEDYLLTSTVTAIQAQRLVRTLCPHCRQAYQPSREVIQRMHLETYAQRFGVNELTLYHPVGCVDCGGTGYTGRACIVEVLPMSETIRRLSMRHAIASEIQTAAQEEGMSTMYDNGVRKAFRGLTTLEEVLRVTREV